MSRDNGGPAFPVICHDVSKTQVIEIGMSLRAYIATHAMQGMVVEYVNGQPQHFKNLAVASCQIADALLEELAKCGA